MYHQTYFTNKICDYRWDKMRTHLERWVFSIKTQNMIKITQHTSTSEYLEPNLLQGQFKYAESVDDIHY